MAVLLTQLGYSSYKWYATSNSANEVDAKAPEVDSVPNNYVLVNNPVENSTYSGADAVDITSYLGSLLHGYFWAS